MDRPIRPLPGLGWREEAPGLRPSRLSAICLRRLTNWLRRLEGRDHEKADRLVPLMYYPKPGEILLCDYRGGFIVPEMVKTRPVIVVSPRLRRRRDLVAVVPLSTTAPTPKENYHCEIVLAQPLPKPFDSPVMWAKADMLATVANSRLDRFRTGKNPHGGTRIYVSGSVDAAQLKAVRVAVLCGLGLDSLTIHL